MEEDLRKGLVYVWCCCWWWFVRYCFSRRERREGRVLSIICFVRFDLALSWYIREGVAGHEREEDKGNTMKEMEGQSVDEKVKGGGEKESETRREFGWKVAVLFCNLFVGLGELNR